MSDYVLLPSLAPIPWTSPSEAPSADPVGSMIASLKSTGMALVPNAQPGRGIILCEEAEGLRVIAATTPRWGWPITRFFLNRVVAKATAEGVSKILVFVSGMVSRDAVEQAEALGINLIFPTSREGV